MNGSAGGSWSLSFGRWRGVELRLHLHFPLLALSVLLLAQLSAIGAYGGTLPQISYRGAIAGLGILALSVFAHELARMGVAHRVGGRTSLVVFGPTGGWSQPYLPSDPPSHLVTALAGPLTYLGIMVASACMLVVHGQPKLLPLLSPFAPHFEPSVNQLHYAAQLAVWINFCLLLINLLPIHPCDGAELLRGMLWPLVGRASASAALAHIAFGASSATFVLAVLFRNHWAGDLAPAWFPLSVLAVLLLYGGNRAARARQYDVGLAIDEFDSDDEQWLHADWLEDDRAVVLVEHLQEKQQEALDRKRRERESQEDARVDAILARLGETSFDQLSEEEQAILKRASRRYRRRREQAP